MTKTEWREINFRREIANFKRKKIIINNICGYIILKETYNYNKTNNGSGKT